MLERVGRFFGRKELDEGETKKAKDFRNLIDSCFTSAVLDEAKFGIKAHVNSIEFGFTVGKKGVRRYFFEETAIEAERTYIKIYRERDGVIIYNKVGKGEVLGNKGARVTEDMLLDFEAKIQRIKNPFTQ